MKLPFKIALINIGIAFLLAALGTIINLENTLQAFLVYYGLIALIGGGISFFIALVLLLSGPKNREWGQGFLLTASILLLTGFLSCSNSLSGLNSH